MSWKHGHKASALLVGAMASAAFLAGGVPGVAQGVSPAQQRMDDELRTRVKLDAKIEIVTDGGESLTIFEAMRKRAEATRAKKPIPASRTLKPYRRDYRAVARMYAKKAGIRDPELFVRQMAAESGYQPCARSYADAMGIAQIIPSTAQSWNVDPWLPEAALRVAAINMSRYERQYNSYTLALAAYNAGPGAVSAYGGVPPYAETREYIRRITTRSYKLPGMTQIYKVPVGMEPKLKRRLAALIRDVRGRGGTLNINEGWRSYQDSVRIWKETKKKRGGWAKARKWAAPPGCSNHTRGYAADLSGDLYLAAQLASKHGLVFPMSWEPWHVELAGISTQSG